MGGWRGACVGAVVPRASGSYGRSPSGLACVGLFAGSWLVTVVCAFAVVDFGPGSHAGLVRLEALICSLLAGAAAIPTFALALFLARRLLGSPARRRSTALLRCAIAGVLTGVAMPLAQRLGGAAVMWDHFLAAALALPALSGALVLWLHAPLGRAAPRAQCPISSPRPRSASAACAAASRAIGTRYGEQDT
jgi:hypothetical protein